MISSVRLCLTITERISSAPGRNKREWRGGNIMVESKQGPSCGEEERKRVRDRITGGNVIFPF